MTAHKKSFESGIQIAWDSTSLSLAQTCLRKYYYAMIVGVKPKKKSVHLLFGGIYASALELFYKRRALGDDIETALLATVREALKLSWNYEAETPGPMHFDDAKKTRSNLIRTIVWYVEQFAVETEDGIMTYHLADGKPAVELSFTLELSDDVLYCGHLDRVVSMANRLYVMDQKTTGGTVGTYYFNQYNPDNQMSGYSWAGQTVLKSPIAGVIIDAAQIAVNFTRFERGLTTRTKAQLDEWRDSALYTISLAQSATQLDRFPMNCTACNNYGGCEYKNLCASDPRVRENYLKSDYISHNWDPLKAR